MLTSKQTKYRDFWSLVQQEFVRAGLDVNFGSNPHDNWVSRRLVPSNVLRSSHLSKCHLAYAFDETGMLKCEINLQSEAAYNKYVFDHLFAEREAVERQFGQNIVWRRADDKDRSQIKVYLSDSSIEKNEVWSLFVCWLYLNSAKMKNVFTDRIVRATRQFGTST